MQKKKNGIHHHSLSLTSNNSIVPWPLIMGFFHWSSWGHTSKPLHVETTSFTTIGFKFLYAWTKNENKTTQGLGFKVSYSLAICKILSFLTYCMTSLNPLKCELKSTTTCYEFCVPKRTMKMQERCQEFVGFVFTCIVIELEELEVLHQNFSFWGVLC
jgi:hypothetical protein